MWIHLIFLFLVSCGIQSSSCDSLYGLDSASPARYVQLTFVHLISSLSESQYREEDNTAYVSPTVQRSILFDLSRVLALVNISSAYLPVRTEAEIGASVRNYSMKSKARLDQEEQYKKQRETLLQRGLLSERDLDYKFLQLKQQQELAEVRWRNQASVQRQHRVKEVMEGERRNVESHNALLKMYEEAGAKTILCVDAPCVAHPSSGGFACTSDYVSMLSMLAAFRP
jgi:hypothetical protein